MGDFGCVRLLSRVIIIVVLLVLHEHVFRINVVMRVAFILGEVGLGLYVDHVHVDERLFSDQSSGGRRLSVFVFIVAVTQLC